MQPNRIARENKEMFTTTNVYNRKIRHNTLA